MSDARSLLRQQRQARRITHAYASYSEAGKLLCIACREPVKTEALWNSHVQSETHLQRVAQLEQRQKETAAPATTTSTKRKHADDEDEDMDGGDGGQGENGYGESGGDEDGSSARLHAERSRRKRSRPDLSDSDSFKEMSRTPPPVPSMTRRSSGTPSQGVELQIPSRPATPRATSSSSNNGGNGSTHSTTLPSRQASTLIQGPPLKPTGTDSAKQQQQGTGGATTTAGASVDEDEWAAFEAEIESKEYATGATISAPVMTSEEIAAAAKAKEEAEGAESSGDPRQRKTQREMDLRNEKEDAQRALEEEFDEMQNLEAKVMRLKQQREALKQRAASHGAHEGGSGSKAPQRPAFGATEKENVAVVEEDEDEDDDDDDDDDGWDGFRFGTGVASRS